MATGLAMGGPVSLDTHGGLMFAVDPHAAVVWEVDLGTGQQRVLAGTGTASPAVEFGMPAVRFPLTAPCAVAAVPDGTVYIYDRVGPSHQDGRVYRVSPDGLLWLHAGGGSSSDDGVAAADAYIRPGERCGLDVDAAGDVVLGTRTSSTGPMVVRRIDASTGNIVTVAGGGGSAGHDVAASEVSFSGISALHATPSGEVLVASRTYVTRLTTDGRATRVAGTGVSGDSGDGGLATDATFRDIRDLHETDAGLFIADQLRVRVVRDGTIRAVDAVQDSLALDAVGQRLLVGQRARVVALDPDETVETVAGMGYLGSGGDGGVASDAQLLQPRDIAVAANGDIYVVSVDRDASGSPTGSRIRHIDARTSVITTIAGGGAMVVTDGVSATQAHLQGVAALVVAGDGTVYFADATPAVRRIAPDGSLELVAGGARYRPMGDGGSATEASLHRPVDLLLDGSSGLHIVDSGHCNIRRVDLTTGIISTVAGTGYCGNSGDGGPATQAGLWLPSAAVFTSDGAMLIAAWKQVRRIGPDGVITTVAGNFPDGTNRSSGDDGYAVAAIFSQLTGLAAAADGSVFVTDGPVIRRIDRYGLIERYAGSYDTALTAGDGGQPGDALLNRPGVLEWAADGSLLIADLGAHRVRAVHDLTPVPERTDPPPAAVSDLRTESGQNAIRLSWTRSADPDFSHVVVRSGGASGEFPRSPDHGEHVYTGTASQAVATGIPDGHVGWYGVFAIDAAGHASPPAVIAAGPGSAFESTQTISTSRSSVPWGQDVEVRGRLVDLGSGAPLPGRPVVLEQRRAGTTAWTTVATAATASNGTVSFRRKPPATTSYRLSYQGDPFHLPSTSPSAKVDVAPAVSAVLSRSKMTLGRSTALSGSVAPAHPGATVRLQRYSAGTWKTVASQALSSKSTYRFKITPSTASRHRYRVVLPAHTDHIRGTSPIRTVSVYSVAITDVQGRTPANLNGETVVIANKGHTPVDLAGWRLESKALGRSHTLPSYPLKPGYRVTVHSGTGTSGSGHLYLGRTAQLLHDSSDIIRLIDLNQHLAAKYSY